MEYFKFAESLLKTTWHIWNETGIDVPTLGKTKLKSESCGCGISCHWETHTCYENVSKENDPYRAYFSCYACGSQAMENAFSYMMVIVTTTEAYFFPMWIIYLLPYPKKLNRNNS